MRVRSKQVVVVSLAVWLLGCLAQGGDTGVSDSLPIESDWSFVRSPAGDLTMVIAPPRLGLAEPGLLVGAIERARRFVEAHPGVFAAAATPGALVLRDLRVDPRGGASVRFSLVVHGLPVDGGDLVCLLAPDGRVRSVAGRFPRLAPPPGEPRVDRASAIALALAAAPAAPDDPFDVLAAPELIAWPDGPDLRPAWRVHLTQDRSALARDIFVDAMTGRILRDRPLARSEAARGSGIAVRGDRRELDIAVSGSELVLRDETRGRGIRTYTAGRSHRLPGQLVRSPVPDRWDEGVPGAGAAVDAHANAAIVWDYLSAVHDRRGLDGQGTAIALVVHHGEDEVNAFWDGRRAVFGDGDGDAFAPFPAALDVVAHELGHGLNEHAAGLVYEAESGALDESLADVFASLVEQRAGDGDWILGEDVNPDGIRDLGDPARLGDPTHLSEKVELPVTPAGDMGGVHINSTIPSHAAYLLTEGGVHALSAVRVHGIGAERVRAIWYRALTLYLAPAASFADFAAATRAAAVDLYGADGGPAASVDEAWRAVGL